MKSSPKHLVIGANSFLGRSLIEQLKEKQADVTGVFHQNTDKLLKDIFYCDVDRLWELPNDYSYVYLISAYIPTQKIMTAEDLNILEKVNVQLPERVVAKFTQAKIIYTSSVAVYGRQTEEINEQSLPYEPNAYGNSKWLGEMAIRKAAKYAIIRISSMYGIGMKEHTFLPNSIKQAIQSNVVKVWGDGSRAQNYIQVRDVAHYLYRAALSTQNGCYLAVDKKSYTNLEIARIIQSQMNCSIEMFGEDDSSSYYYQNQDTNQVLNYEPKYTLVQNLEEIIKWIKRKYS